MDDRVIKLDICMGITWVSSKPKLISCLWAGVLHRRPHHHLPSGEIAAKRRPIKRKKKNLQFNTASLSKIALKHLKTQKHTRSGPLPTTNYSFATKHRPIHSKCARLLKASICAVPFRACPRHYVTTSSTWNDTVQRRPWTPATPEEPQVRCRRFKKEYALFLKV
uniref:SFRICE_002495 n=1 Tax=Spodoptera frugiperda TaxID=7108 RepID=A0A2H1WFB2_SPOFR